MENSTNQLVYIMISESTGNIVYPAYLYQSYALHDYCNNSRIGKYLYISPIDSRVKFYIDNFKNCGLQGNYEDVYLLCREDGTSSPISMNEGKIRALCSFINRIITY